MNVSGYKMRLFPQILTLVGVTLLSLSARSQTRLEEIIVTAHKREQSAFKVPVSLSVVDAEEIKVTGISGAPSLRGRVPGLLAIPHPNAESTLGIYLRGVGNPDEQIIQDPSVGIYVDGIYIPRSQGLGLDLVELDRVEVLRGPQGALYGRNSAGGAINFLTRLPGTSTRRFSQQLSLGSRDLQRSRTVLDLPLADNMAVSASYLTIRDHGFVRNSGTGVEYFGSRDRQAGQLDFLWGVSGERSLRVKMDAMEHRDSPAFIDRVANVGEAVDRPASGDPNVRNLRRNGMQSAGISLVAEQKFGSKGILKYLAGQRNLDDRQYQDFHTGLSGPDPLLVTTADGSHTQYSHELQWLGQAHGAGLEYVLGYFRFREDAVRAAENLFPQARTARMVFGRQVNSESRALYGQLTWRPAYLGGISRIMLGGRHNNDQRIAVLERASRNLATGAVSFAPRQDVGTRSFREFTPSAGLLVDISDTGLLYFTFAEGYKSGGFNARASTPQRFAAGFAEEDLSSREIGFKGDFPALNSRLQLALFDTRYDSIQLEVRSNPLDYTVSDFLNAGDARIRGLELELETAPWRGVRFGFTYSGLVAAYHEVLDANGRNVADDYRFVGAPRHAIHGRLDLALGTIAGAAFDAGLQYSWQERFYSSATLAAGPYTVPAYSIINASLQMQRPLSNGEFRAGLWARNVFDKAYFLGHFNGGAGLVVPSAIWGEPRTIGIDIEYRL